MATNAIYITVRLDIESQTADTISKEEVSNLISDMDYSFREPEGSTLTIIDTEICGLNE